MRPRRRTPRQPTKPNDYRHPESETPLRPEVGTQAQFRKRKKPVTYRYDPSLAPELNWDMNPAREQGEALIAEIQRALAEAGAATAEDTRRNALNAAMAAAEKLKAMSAPFLNWAGKAERLSFDVPTLPLFVHERLSTQAIIETLKTHLKEGVEQANLFADPRHSVADQVLQAYEHQDKWVNRMLLGDSLVVMNSLLHYENLGGQVQMIYMDPPYGVKFGSNFQPFVRKRDVEDGSDADMTREPETVKAYRDTWELGLHSYLTYLRDRLLLCRELLHPSGSVFVQISDENLHHVREIMDEVFGAKNFVVTIPFKKKGGQKGGVIDPVNDYLLWYHKESTFGREKFRPLYEKLEMDRELAKTFRYVELSDGTDATLAELTKKSKEGVDYTERQDLVLRDHPGAKHFKSENLTSGGYRRTQSVVFQYKGQDFDPGIAKGNCWKHSATTDDGSPSGMDKLAVAERLHIGEKQLGYKRYLTDFGYKALTNWWDGLGGAARPVFAVQTNEEVIRRCLLMTTDPGDLVLDPTCGSGTTAYVAEQWGRRWITCDVSRVPLALARQRLLTATFDYYELKEPERGPAGGFVYRRKQNAKGEEVGGIVPHITSSSIANDEPPKEEVLVDRPEKVSNVVRVSGPFVVEGTIPAPLDWDQVDDESVEDIHETDGDRGSFEARMLDVLRSSPVLHAAGKTITFRNIRPPAKTLSLSAEAFVDAAAQAGAAAPARVAIVFGPENGALTEMRIFEAAREAYAKSYSHLYVIGFAIEGKAREFVEKCDATVGIPATYVQMTPDVTMSDLLKNMRSSQIFSVCGLPEVSLRKRDGGKYEVELLGLDVYDPANDAVDHRTGNDVPAWFLDTDYNGLCFHVCQAFFPRTSAWESLKKALKATHEESVWDHLAGTVSAPFEAGGHGQIAVKVIDDRGNELLVTRRIEEA